MTGAGAAPLLFVDDEPLVRKVFAKTLEHEGIDVDLAANATEAIELATEREYQVIATDLNMPGLDGLSLIEHLRQLQPTAAFMVVTGLPEAERRSDSGIYDAVVEVVEKPWERAQLVGAVKRALGLEPSAAPRAKPRLLLLEDDPDYVELVSLLLRTFWEKGPEIVTARCLADAVELLTDTEFELIICDLSLPDADGLEAVDALFPIARNTAIIVLTGKDDKQLALESIKRGAQDFLFKGNLDVDSLERAVRFAMERKRMEVRLDFLAHFDALTGLANRVTFRDCLERLIARSLRKSSRFALLHIDLDNFKRINEGLGHKLGDALLQVIGNRIRSEVRQYDVVGRMGGDEFAVLVEGLQSHSDLEQMVVRLSAVLADPVMLENTEIVISSSIGVAVYPANGVNAEELVTAAQQAILDCKMAGGGLVQSFVLAHHNRPSDRLGLEGHLRRAWESREFEVHFQPIFDLSQRRIVSLEALLRWPAGASLSIDTVTIISVLEEIALIGPVTKWVLGTACRQLQRAAIRAADLRVAVNLSPRLFHRPGLAETVRAVVEQTGIEPSHLELEIPEALLKRDDPTAMELLADLRSNDVRLVIDGFGAGVSSLALLHRHGIAGLKIDRSFIAEIAGDGCNSSLIGAMVGLGHHLNLGVTAVGIESDHQLDVVRAAGCDFGQGFLLARPVPSDAIPEIASKSR